MENKGKFESALYGVAPRLRRTLEKLPAVVKRNAEEIRLRCDCLLYTSDAADE